MDYITTLYTDGGIKGNGKEYAVGAYAFTAKNGNHYYEYSNIELGGTNQTAELKALIVALYFCKENNIGGIVKVISDSKYVIGCATQWLDSWRAKGYQNKTRDLKNRDLIIILDKLIQSLGAELTMEHVKGHSGETGNERVDALCTETMENYIANEVG